LDGNRQDLGALVAALPDQASALVCVAGRVPVGDFEGCALVLIKNHGQR